MLGFQRSRIKHSENHFLRFLCLLHIYLGGGFIKFLISPRTLGKWSNLTNIFQRGWNHQLVYLTLQTNTTVGNGKIHCTTRKFHGGIIQLCKSPTWPEEYLFFVKLMGIVEFIPLVASLYRYIFVWYWFSLFIVEKLVGTYLYLHLYVCIFFIWAG